MTYASLVAAVHERISDVVRPESARAVRMAWGESEARWRLAGRYVRVVNDGHGVLVARGHRGSEPDADSQRTLGLDLVTVEHILGDVRWMEMSADLDNARFARFEQRA